MRIWVNTVFKLTSLKTEIARLPEDQNYKAPCRRRIGGAVPRAEIFDDSITADHTVLSEDCESRNNHRYAVVVQELATQCIGAKQKLLRKHKGACKSSWSQVGSLKSFTLTIPGICQSL